MNKIKQFLPILLTFCVIFVFYIKRFVFLKFYPPLCNFFIFLIFFISLFRKETIIQSFARACGDKLEKPARIYTRNLTYIWAGFTFLNFIVSIWTIFQSDKIWMLYNACISYILIGTLFLMEYIVRICLKNRNLI